MWQVSKRIRWSLAAVFLLVFMMSCNLLDSVIGNQVEELSAEAIAMATEAAIQMQTRAAEPVSQPFITQTWLAMNAPTETQPPVPTQTSTNIPAEELSQTPPVEMTATQGLTVTPTASLTPSLTNTPVPPTQTPATISGNEILRFKTAKILVLEDIAGDTQLVPRLDTVLANMGLTSDNVINVHDATGKFVEYLESDQTWDLIIVATEKRTEARLDIWEKLYEHVENGGALILEAYYLDEIGGGTIKPLLDMCGVEVQVDWYRKTTDEAYQYVVYDIARNNHRLFNEPNKIDMPLIPTFYWKGDVGDLMQILPVSSGHLIGGLNYMNTVHAGLITECVDGRMLIQSFSTHNYRKEDTIALWENYITNAMRSHFAASDAMQ